MLSGSFELPPLLLSSIALYIALSSSWLFTIIAMGCYENIIICMNIYLCLSLLSCSSICMAICSALISSSTWGAASYLLLFCCLVSLCLTSSAAAFFSLSYLSCSRSSLFSLVSLSSSFCWALDLTRCPTSESLRCFTVVWARASSSLSFLTSYLS